MLHYPTYPDGRPIQAGDIYTFDSDTQFGLIVYIYPNEAIVKDYKEQCDHKVYYRSQIASYYLSFDSLIHLSVEDLYEEGPPHYVTNINIERVYDFISRQRDCGEMDDYISCINYWKNKQHN